MVSELLPRPPRRDGSTMPCIFGWQLDDDHGRYWRFGDRLLSLLVKNPTSRVLCKGMFPDARYPPVPECNLSSCSSCSGKAAALPWSASSSASLDWYISWKVSIVFPP